MEGQSVDRRADSFAALLRRYRGAKGLTQEELAERSGVSVKAISMLERGVRTSPRATTVEFLAAALRLDETERAAFTAARRDLATPPSAHGADVDADAATELAEPGAAAAAATRTLPRAVTSFTGRDEELARLLAAVTGAARPGPAVEISAIDGMAGVGKTTFAVRAAHQLASRFPDGQLFLDLHAHTAGQHPVKPADALRSLLLTIGVSAQRIPPDLDARAALWRDRVAGRRLLLLLDDAASHEQVRPLVPGASGCLVLVTSRRRLTALEDAESLTLRTLPPAEAVALFTRLSGARDRDTDPAAVAKLVELCGHLPLAIRLLAGQLRSHPTWSPAYLLGRYTDGRDPLVELQAEDVAVGAVFQLSYRALPAEQQRLFRRLGLHPGRDIDAHAAAALADVDVATARRQLEALYTDNLIEEPVPGRYRLHDLMRAHARALAAGDDEPGNEAANGRLVAYYIRWAAGAVRHIARRIDSTLPAGPSGESPFPASPRGALAWLEAERPNLAAWFDQAARSRPADVVLLSHAMHPYLRSAGHWDQAVDIHEFALAAARDSGDPLGQARSLHDLGVVRRTSGAYQASAASLREALTAYRAAGDQLGVARALTDLAVLERMTGEHDAAASTLAEALGVFSDVGSDAGRAHALVELGNVQRLTGAYETASASLSEGLRLHRTLGDERGQADALHYLGTVRCELGAYADAMSSLVDALAICRDLGDRSGQASTLNNLAVAQYETGDYPAAVASLVEALELFRELGSRHGQAAALDGLGHVHRVIGPHPTAAGYLREAIALFAALGNPLGQADALNELGTVQALTGDHPSAIASLTEALRLFESTGHQRGQADTLNRFGTVMLDCAGTDQALDHHRRALCLAREVGVPLEEARALEGIGRCLLQARIPDDAITNLRDALAIYDRLGVPERTRIEATLTDLGAG